MTSGLTPEGFNKKTFEEIKSDIETTLRDSFGTINLDDESVFGQLVGIFTEREALLWLALEAVYNAMYPDTANDFSLDNVCQFIGLTRLEATPTKVSSELTGLNQTLIPRGSETSAPGINTIFKLDTDVLITNEACIRIKIDITDISQATYTIIINATSITYTKQVDDTKTLIINGLLTLINEADPPLGVIASNIDDILVVNSELPKVFNIYISTGMDIVNITTIGMFTATTEGFIPLPAGALTTIITPISGWISIFNPTAGASGRNLETDVELRIRRAKSLRLAGAGTLEAIRARLLNISGVTSVTIIENTTDNTVENLAPHSFEALVLGGENQDIGNTIWQSKPAGIQSYGNIEVTILDSTGRQQVVNFSRPVPRYIYVNVAITKDNINTYPSNGDDIIKAGIVAQITALSINEDVIYQSLYQSVYKVSGITEATITIGGTLVELEIPTYNSANIDIGSAEIAVTDLTKIIIT